MSIPKIKSTRRTSLLLPPTLDEVKRAAAAIDLPEREAIRFFNFYDSKGWLVGCNRMVSFTGALANWKMSWEDRGGANGKPAGGSGGGAKSVEPLSGADKMIYQKEYERIVARMQLIRAGYAEMQSWSKRDKEDFERLRARRTELKKLLGLTI